MTPRPRRGTPGRARRRIVVQAIVLAVLGTLLPQRTQAHAPGWATPWTASTGDATSVAYSGAWNSYATTLGGDPGTTYWWRLGDASGSTMTATSGGVNGTYGNSPTLGQTGALGTSNTAVRLNGTNQYATVAHQNGFSFSGTAAYSIEVLFKLGSLAASGNPRLVTKMDYNGSYDGYDLAYNGASDTYPGQLYCARWANGSATYVGSFGLALSAGTWAHIVCTYDGSTLRFYFNGELRESAASTGSMSTGTPLYVGSLQGGGQDFANGTFDEISITNVALSARQVRSHYYAYLSGL
ncbi:MAG: LamG domain-containing protein [Kineosporiaceae bacterium]